MLLRCLQADRIERACASRSAGRCSAFSGYAVLRCISIAGDYLKWSTGSFGHQLLVEMVAGISFALAVLFLQLGLLVALLRYRLYDAEIVISRSANFALITLAVAAIFAAHRRRASSRSSTIITATRNSEGPVIFAAALVDRARQPDPGTHAALVRAAVPEEPVPASRRFARESSATCARPPRSAKCSTRSSPGSTAACARCAARRSSTAASCGARRLASTRSRNGASRRRRRIIEATSARPSDRLFPIRVPLVPSSDEEAPIGYLLVGPRPDGSIPSRDEQKALAGVSEPIARAIRTVIKREAREAQVAELIAETRAGSTSSRRCSAGRPRFEANAPRGTA